MGVYILFMQVSCVPMIHCDYKHGIYMFMQLKLKALALMHNFLISQTIISTIQHKHYLALPTKANTV